jgi:hypothetical protein
MRIVSFFLYIAVAMTFFCQSTELDIKRQQFSTARPGVLLDKARRIA